MRFTVGLLLLWLNQPALSAPAGSPAPPLAITPLTSYSEALRQASATGRNVLLLFSNPHCGPCHAMEDVLFHNPAGAELVAASYVPVVLVINLGGTDKTRETAEARATATRFGVVHPPALLALSRRGAKLGRLVGITRAELFGGLRQYAPPVP
jgi:thioredoxin-related protein